MIYYNVRSYFYDASGEILFIRDEDCLDGECLQNCLRRHGRYADNCIKKNPNIESFDIKAKKVQK